VWVRPGLADRFWQPLAGWLGHAAPFDFTPDYKPAAGINRYVCGTPPVLSLAALECGVDTVLAAEPWGGVAALRTKSLALTRLFAAQVQAACPELTLVSPTPDAQRGSQVCFAHAEMGYAVMQALIARGVIGDFRAPDILRFGFTPLYVRYVDAWDAAWHVHQVLSTGEWRQPQFAQRRAVT
jgi:kynureninase